MRKSDIQAALAKAQVKALLMTPNKQHQHQHQFTSNFDPSAAAAAPTHIYGFPQYVFDDFTMLHQALSSDQVTAGSTAFSGGSSDCDYSS